MNTEETMVVEQSTTSVFDNESIDSILDTLNGVEHIEPAQVGSVVEPITQDVAHPDPSRFEVFVDTGTDNSTEHLDLQIADTTLNRENVSAVNESSFVETQNQEETSNNEEQQSTEELIDQMTEDFNVLNEGHNENMSRFSGAEWFEKVRNFRILIAGIGGIGSFLSFYVSRLQPDSIRMFDDDTVEEANLSGQLFSMDDITETKAGEMSRFIERYSNYYHTSVYIEKYTGQSTEDIMICGFDNMAARKVFFLSWKNHVTKKLECDRKKCLFIDGRLGMEEMQIFAIRGDELENMNRYAKEFLFSDAEAERVPCSMKQTTFMASMIGSVMTNILVNHAVNIDSPMDVRPIPFLTLYDASDMRMQLKF